MRIPLLFLQNPGGGGGIEPPSCFGPLDSPAKLGTSEAFTQGEAGPKTAGKVPNNPRETGPGPVDRK
jgi:hypothetical protein